MRYFSSAIDNKTLSDFQKYDSSIREFENRLELVTDMINDDNGNLSEFFVKYFGEYYDVSPNQKGWLAEQDAVCKAIEGLGTYLLNSKDIKSNRKVKYRFWKSEKEYQKYAESNNINASSLESGDDDGVDVIDLFYTNDDKNFKKTTEQRLFSKDIKGMPEIMDLQKGIDRFKDESYIKKVEKHLDNLISTIEDEKDLARLKSIRRNVPNYLQRWASSMSDNQLLIKEAITRPIRFKKVTSGGAKSSTHSGSIIEEKDFDNQGYVKSLLKNLDVDDITTDLGMDVYDLNKLIAKMDFDDDSKVVIGMLKEGFSQKEICECLNVERYVVSRRITRIAKQIVEYFINQKIVF